MLVSSCGIDSLSLSFECRFDIGDGRYHADLHRGAYISRTRVSSSNANGAEQRIRLVLIANVAERVGVFEVIE